MTPFDDDFLDKAKKIGLKVVLFFIILLSLPSFLGTVCSNNLSSKGFWHTIWIIESNGIYIILGVAFLFFLYALLRNCVAFFKQTQDRTMRNFYNAIKKTAILLFGVYLSIKMVVFTWLFWHIIGLIIRMFV